ncbi:acyl-CoA-binding protein [Parachitinimonas caeni]|uniref:Acyl-CoA-binding protein n=1 Tax=Parachitinimonas caeni TaxID=3031301 RepID=A0ABT7DR92_9NEIS|nr:acyl-CoA-binding protein [Parachitinimonas caeni]MDK2122585.1 acyl-CoA-binding protein [Parachitinimonas caeni]
MSDLEAQFKTAAEDVTQLSEAPDNQVKLKLYALYKQGTEGDASGERPGMFDFVARAKFDAWDGLKGLSKEEAMQKYIDLVEALKAAQ